MNIGHPLMWQGFIEVWFDWAMDQKQQSKDKPTITVVLSVRGYIILILTLLNILILPQKNGKNKKKTDTKQFSLGRHLPFAGHAHFVHEHCQRGELGTCPCPSTCSTSSLNGGFFVSM